MTNYVRGRNAEYKAMEVLRKAGFQAFRTAGSKGAFDVVAVNDSEVLFLQIKRTKSRRNTKNAEEALTALPCPPFVKKAVWVWKDGQGFVERKAVT